MTDTAAPTEGEKLKQIKDALSKAVWEALEAGGIELLKATSLFISNRAAHSTQPMSPLAKAIVLEAADYLDAKAETARTTAWCLHDKSKDTKCGPGKKKRFSEEKKHFNRLAVGYSKSARALRNGFAAHSHPVETVQADVQPVMWRWRWSEGPWSVSSIEPIIFRFGEPDEMEPLYPQATVAALEAERDIALEAFNLCKDGAEKLLIRAETAEARVKELEASWKGNKS